MGQKDGFAVQDSDKHDINFFFFKVHFCSNSKKVPKCFIILFQKSVHSYRILRISSNTYPNIKCAWRRLRAEAEKCIEKLFLFLPKISRGQLSPSAGPQTTWSRIMERTCHKCQFSGPSQHSLEQRL